MMIESSSKGYEGNQQQEGENNNYIKIEKVSSKAASTSSKAWSAFRNPRIVRVSRSFGGKDRHSKVCTIRGLRDRRIRLSVPTAIQLYDLQDRLGLNQPSKVVDWLLEATKSDIDKLPQLQIPHCFAQFHQQTLLPPGTSHHLGGLFYDANINQNLMPKSRYLDIDSLKGKELLENVSISQKGKEWIKTNEQENQNFFPFGTTNSSSLPGLLNNGMAYNNSYHHSEPSSLSLSQFGSHGLFPSSSSGSQLLFCPPPPPSGAAPSAFYSVESDPRQSNNNNNNNNNNVQILSSSSQVMMPHPLIQCFHSINSPLRRLPMPFSSKPLDDSDNHNNRSSTPDKD